VTNVDLRRGVVDLNTNCPYILVRAHIIVNKETKIVSTNRTSFAEQGVVLEDVGIYKIHNKCDRLHGPGWTYIGVSE
jgi:hypothetical protein